MCVCALWCDRFDNWCRLANGAAFVAAAYAITGSLQQALTHTSVRWERAHLLANRRRL